MLNKDYESIKIDRLITVVATGKEAASIDRNYCWAAAETAGQVLAHTISTQHSGWGHILPSPSLLLPSHSFIKHNSSTFDSRSLKSDLVGCIIPYEFWRTPLLQQKSSKVPSEDLKMSHETTSPVLLLFAISCKQGLLVAVVICGATVASPLGKLLSLEGYE